MLSGTHRNSVQEQVVYGRPALDALADLAKGLGTRRLCITSTASLAGPGGLAERLAAGLAEARRQPLGQAARSRQGSGAGDAEPPGAQALGQIGESVQGRAAIDHLLLDAVAMGSAEHGLSSTCGTIPQALG